MYKVTVECWIDKPRKYMKIQPHEIVTIGKYKFITHKEIAEKLVDILDQFKLSKKADSYILDIITGFISKNEQGLAIHLPTVDSSYPFRRKARCLSLETLHIWQDDTCYVRVRIVENIPSSVQYAIPLFGCFDNIDPFLALLAMDHEEAEALYDQKIRQLDKRFPGISYFLQPVDYLKRTLERVYFYPLRHLRTTIFDKSDMAVFVPYYSYMRTNYRNGKRVFILGSPAGLHYLYYYRVIPPKTLSSLLRHNGIKCTEHLLSKGWNEELGLQILLGLDRVEQVKKIE